MLSDQETRSYSDHVTQRRGSRNRYYVARGAGRPGDQASDPPVSKGRRGARQSPTPPDLGPPVPKHFVELFDKGRNLTHPPGCLGLGPCFCTGECRRG